MTYRRELSARPPGEEKGRGDTLRREKERSSSRGMTRILYRKGLKAWYFYAGGGRTLNVELVKPQGTWAIAVCVQHELTTFLLHK